MTASSPCDRLDAYLDGRLAPDEEAAFEAHLAACETCLEEPVLPDDLRGDLAAVACPPGVVEAALRQARRAPDRTPQPRAHRPMLRVGWVAAALLAVAAAVWVWPAPRPAETVAVASRDMQTPTDPVEETTPAIAPPAPDRPPESAPAGAPVVEQTTSAPSPRPPSPVPTRAPASARPDRLVPPVAPDALVAEAPPASPDSVAAARAEVLLALAIVANAQGRAAGAVADGVGRVSDALHSTPHLLSPHTP